MSRYNHMYSIAFIVINGSEGGERTTASEVRRAILERLASTTDDELLEAIGYPDDTYEMTGEAA